MYEALSSEGRGLVLIRNMTRPVVVIHGGAGDIIDEKVPETILGVKKAAEMGYEVLARGGSSLDAVQAAVEEMENDPRFNAGTGGVLNLNGELEMDAIVMEGTNLKVGSVGCVSRILNPVALARKVMEKSNHAMLVGEGARVFAAEQNIKTVPAYRLVTESAIERLENFLKHKADRSSLTGTVGAVAVDKNGKVAMATSTGGTLGKAEGRIGDTPLPGCGGYADDKVGAVSATGHGESIMRACLSARVITQMEQGMRVQTAVENALNYLESRIGGPAGVIAVSNQGDIGISFTSKRMAWAYKMADEPAVGGVDKFNN